MSERPNVLLVNTDHWFSSLMGCAGNPYIMTPTLDNLAGNGIRFENFYSECPVCVPARRSLMTGMSPRSHGDRVFDDTMPLPPVITMAQAFRDAGYQAYAVGKLHAYPQRSRIGFDDVLLQEEGRYELGTTDDYQIWLGENGYTGQEFLHAMGNNNYYTRTWHLPENAHPTNWTTMQMMRQIKRRDPTRPAFFYASYTGPHPPLVPLRDYWEMYAGEEVPESLLGDWVDDSPTMQMLYGERQPYSERERRRAIRAFYAQCTHIDHQIRLLIGTLRECNMLDNTVIAFVSDHGDMLFQHNMVAKRTFYEGSACIPFIVCGNPLGHLKGTVEKKLGCLADVMPTLLNICNIDIPETVEGIPLLTGQGRPLLFGEIGENGRAARMIHNGRFKLIYYPFGNLLHLFDLENDPGEMTNLAGKMDYAAIRQELVDALISNLYGDDLDWIVDGKLVGLPGYQIPDKKDFGLYNQRGLHWPPPTGYQNLGKTK